MHGSPVLRTVLASVIVGAVTLGSLACSPAAQDDVDGTGSAAFREVASLVDGSGCATSDAVAGPLGPMQTRVTFATRDVWGSPRKHATVEVYDATSGYLRFARVYRVVKRGEKLSLGTDWYANGPENPPLFNEAWQLSATPGGGLALTSVEATVVRGAGSRVVGTGPLAMSCDESASGAASVLTLATKARPATPRQTTRFVAPARFDEGACTATGLVGPDGGRVLRFRFQRQGGAGDFSDLLVAAADVYDRHTGLARDLFDGKVVDLAAPWPGRNDLSIGEPPRGPSNWHDPSYGTLIHRGGQARFVPSPQAPAALRELVGSSVAVDCTFAE